MDCRRAGSGTHGRRFRPRGRKVGEVGLRLGDRVLVVARDVVRASRHRGVHPGTAEFFAAAGLPILQAYGLTENVCVAFNRPDKYKFGTVGPPMPGCEVRIAADKEILVRSEMMFSGYYKAPGETAKVFQDGWLLTGDLGEIDEEGFLKIIGRKKELIVTSTGKKVSPALLENLLKEHHLISQAMVYGEGRSYLVALITLNSVASREAVQSIVDDVNRRVSSTESIKRFAVLDRDFEIARDEITPTGKLKRDVITDRFRQVIDGLYLAADSRG